ncbi:hypothetical protein UFOVP326_40 [uncultured Caudovirales phage]|uniref:Uncharacterized protein n=1 Tax=uncultured Caudovirales phage TaxID=2100421 RepID=A0A6J5LWW4_9CAUD|nr:hypothetical protein UFOVP326_40 [uncultured Caudovirales phage]
MSNKRHPGPFTVECRPRGKTAWQSVTAARMLTVDRQHAQQWATRREAEQAMARMSGLFSGPLRISTRIGKKAG